MIPEQKGKNAITGILDRADPAPGIKEAGLLSAKIPRIPDSRYNALHHAGFIRCTDALL